MQNSKLKASTANEQLSMAKKVLFFINYFLLYLAYVLNFLKNKYYKVKLINFFETRLGACRRKIVLILTT